MRCLLVALLFMPLTAAALDDEVQFVGVGIYNHPKFDGSSAQHNDLIPQIQYLNRSWFVRTTEGILEGGLRWGIGQSAAVGVQAAADEPRLVVDGGGGERCEQHCKEQRSHGAPLYHDPEKLALRLAMKAAIPSRASRVRACSAMACASSSIWVSSDSPKL